MSIQLESDVKIADVVAYNGIQISHGPFKALGDYYVLTLNVSASPLKSTIRRPLLAPTSFAGLSVRNKLSISNNELNSKWKDTHLIRLKSSSKLVLK